jgi:ATP-binding cassette subfamily C protein
MASMIALAAFVRVLWRDHRREMTLVAVLSIVLLLTEGIGLLMLVPLLRQIGVGAGDRAADATAAMMDRALGALHVAPTLSAVLLVMVLLVSARAAAQWMYVAEQARLEADVVGSLRSRLFTAVVGMPWARYTGERPAAILHAIGPQVDDVHSALIMSLQGLSLVATVAAGAVASLVLSPLLFAVVAASGVLALLLARVLRAPGRVEGEQLLRAAEGLFARLGELLGGLKMVHAHDADGAAIGTVQRDTAEWAQLVRRVATRRAGVGFALAVAAVVLLAALVMVATQWVHVPPASLLVLLALYARLVPRLLDVHQLWSQLRQSLAAFESVQRLLDRCEAAARDDAGAPAPAAAAVRVAPVVGRQAPPAIALRRVTYRYPGATDDAVRDATFDIPAGRVTALVGESGAGKTTVGDLVLGLLQPSAGELLVDGRPLREWPRSAWRGMLGYLAQDPMLLHGSIRENLCLARPDASEPQLRAALAAAVCDFVGPMPQDLDVPIGDRGVQLSGGERQRLALARALLREPRLLVLDEATSALDAETEERVLRSLGELRGRCTVLMITHRMAPREIADLVIEL